jgi:hypothetical protein
MRWLLYVAAVLVFLAGVQLFVFPERTSEFFAWTIDPPLTAAFLGAAYWSSVGFEAVAARQRRWVDARIAVPTVFVFTVLTLVVTLVHLDLFHLGDEFELRTQAVTWVWLAIYSVVPVLMVVLLITQARVAGTDPPPRHPPPVWLSGLVGAQAVLLGTVGFVLLIAPGQAGEIWPWDLTPLTARAIGAWLLSLGVAAGHALWERDIHRMRPAVVAYLAFGLLQGLVLARYPDTLDWTAPTSYIYVAFLISALVVGVAARGAFRPHD